MAKSVTMVGRWYRRTPLNKKKSRAPAFPRKRDVSAKPVPGVALLVTGLILNWELGLVMLACVPFIGGSVAILSKLMSSSTQEGVDHYSKAGGVATEVRMLPKSRAVGCPGVIGR